MGKYESWCVKIRLCFFPILLLCYLYMSDPFLKPPFIMVNSPSPALGESRSVISPESARGEGWSRVWGKKAGPCLNWSARVGFHLWPCMGCCLGVVPWEISARTGCSSFYRDYEAFRSSCTVSNAVLFLGRIWPVVSEVMWDLGFLPILKWSRWVCCCPCSLF